MGDSNIPPKRTRAPKATDEQSQPKRQPRAPKSDTDGEQPKRTAKSTPDTDVEQPAEQPKRPPRAQKPPVEQAEPQRVPAYCHIERKYRDCGWEVIKLAPFDATAALVCKRHVLDQSGVPGARGNDLHLVRIGAFVTQTDNFVRCAELLGARGINASVRVVRDSGRLIITFEDVEGKKITI